MAFCGQEPIKSIIMGNNIRIHVNTTASDTQCHMKEKRIQKLKVQSFTALINTIFKPQIKYRNTPV
jgi:hypothetical protein